MSCNHRRRGIVTNQPDGYDSTRPLASRACCDREECVQHTKSMIAKITNETAYFIPDADRTVQQ